MTSKLSIVACVAHNLTIGIGGRLPWVLPTDLKHFREITNGKKMIAGYNTFHYLNDTIDLGSRELVLSRDGDDLHDEGIVIGGAHIYNKYLGIADTMHITHVMQDVDGDVFFPPKAFEMYECTDMSEIYIEDGLPFCFAEYRLKHEEYQYLDLITEILTNGTKRGSPGRETLSVFGHQMRFDMENGFPLITTKKMFFKGIKKELDWFLSGSTNAKILSDDGVHIWDKNTSREYLDSKGLHHYEIGDAGPIYSHSLRHYGAPYINCKHDYTGQGIDQWLTAIDLIKERPNSRNIIINMWNPMVLDEVCLPQCHVLYQYYVEDNKYLNLSFYQRSADICIGVPFNISSAALMLYRMAEETNLIPKTLVHSIGDAHIYEQHIPFMLKQLVDIPKPFPTLSDDLETIENYNYSEVDGKQMDMIC